ncbi:MAG: hypothetical protein KKH88_00020 [Nanoarchaeota archaeon]|nr:hypothetical protein [Nanoarchaeota archaeon]MBU1445147.1 hypothetical protein [Nanoarchaeota archaeon]MBU2406656.1 hypothetical protein [Nanoarchaeota archaeon]MBU2420067.1 hypothetical protein [Nanoarchaeota archaeon]MBU2475574.1 hypothetical protein [Nanoarchaeota archaeon]
MDNNPKKLLKVSEGKKVAIFPHKDPDGDALSAGFGLQNGIYRKNGIESVIVHFGVISTAENQRLYSALSKTHPNLFVAYDPNTFNPGDYGFFIGVDTAGNLLPEGIKLNGAIDHHGDAYKEGDFKEFEYCDVRKPSEIKSASSIVALYMKKLGIELSVDDELDILVATALSVGIEMDTARLINRTSLDLEALGFVEPMVDQSQRKRILKVEKPKQVALAEAEGVLNSTQVGSYVISSVLRRPKNDRAIVYTANSLLLMEGASCSLGLGILEDDDLLGIAVRTDDDHKLKASDIAAWWGGQGKNYEAWATVDLRFFKDLTGKGSDKKLEQLCMEAVVGRVKRETGERESKDT